MSDKEKLPWGLKEVAPGSMKVSFISILLKKQHFLNLKLNLSKYRKTNWKLLNKGH